MSLKFVSIPNSVLVLCNAAESELSLVSVPHRLECCGLTALSCEALVSTLIGNQNLKIMNLTQNVLGYEGIKKLSEVLRSAICKLQVLG